MEGLAGAASVIAVVDITMKIASALKDYYEGVRDAREDIQKLFHCMKSLEELLRDIQPIVEKDGNMGSTLTTDPAGPLPQLKTELEQILEKLPPVTQGRRARLAQSLGWPFKKSGVEKSVNTIERHKISLSLCVGIKNQYV